MTTAAGASSTAESRRQRPARDATTGENECRFLLRLTGSPGDAIQLCSEATEMSCVLRMLSSRACRRSRTRAVTYPNARLGVDVRFDVVAAGVKETAILDRSTSSREFLYRLTTSSADLRLRADGRAAIWSNATVPPGSRSAGPVVIDAARRVVERRPPGGPPPPWIADVELRLVHQR